MHILLQAQSGNPLIFFVLIFGVFWFFMIRPQVKKQKDERKFRQNIKKGDKVVTTGGIHAKVTGVSESTVLVDAGEGVKLKIDKSALSLELSPRKSKQINKPIGFATDFFVMSDQLKELFFQLIALLKIERSQLPIFFF